MARIATAEVTFKLSWAVPNGAPDAQLSDVIDTASLESINDAIQEVVGSTVIVELE